jgi:hypothetical protein
VQEYNPQVVLLCTGASDSRTCFWDRCPDPKAPYRLGDHYGQNLREMALWLTTRGFYVLLVTPPALLQGKSPFGDCDSVERLFGHSDPRRVFNRTRIEKFIVPAQRYVVRALRGVRSLWPRARSQPRACHAAVR